MRYTDDLIEELIQKNNIVDIIGENVRLKRAGSNYTGLCPFHSEKTPSFSVSPSRQMYYCFGCHAGGNVITFLMEYHNYTFPEALRYLAERAGITLPEETLSETQKAAARWRDEQLQLMKQAAGFYYYRLKSDAGAAGLSYLKKRGLTDETIRHFGLGYADRYGHSLYRYLKEKGAADDALRDSGLVRFDEKRGASDLFYNRVIFPIMDSRGRVIGFGGRVMGDGKPKYLNSPESRLFNKRKNLYALNYARSQRAGCILLCEGYMDVISMHQAGFTNAVASLGTALTEEQAQLLSRFTKEVRLLYDSDSAGVMAALRAIPILKEAGIEPRIVNLAPYKDPDELIRAIGKEGMQERLDSSENAFLFEVRQLEANYTRGDPASWTAFQREVASRLVSSFPEELERDNYLEAVCGRYGFPKSEFRRMMGRIASAGMPAEKAVPPKKKGGKDGPAGNHVRTEQRMLSYLVNDRAAYSETRDLIGPEDFFDPVMRRAAEELYGQLRDGHVSAARLIAAFAESEEQKAVASAIGRELMTGSAEERDRAFTDTVVRMLRFSNDTKLAEADITDLTVYKEYIEKKKSIEAFDRGRILHLTDGNRINSPPQSRRDTGGDPEGL